VRPVAQHATGASASATACGARGRRGRVMQVYTARRVSIHEEGTDGPLGASPCRHPRRLTPGGGLHEASGSWQQVLPVLPTVSTARRATQSNRCTASRPRHDLQVREGDSASGRLKYVYFYLGQFAQGGARQLHRLSSSLELARCLSLAKALLCGGDWIGGRLGGHRGGAVMA